MSNPTSSMTFTQVQETLDRLFGGTPSEEEKACIRDLQNGLCAHRGASLALSHLESMLVLDRQRINDEMLYLQGRLESIQIDLDRTKIHQREWINSFDKAYKDILGSTKPE